MHRTDRCFRVAMATLLMIVRPLPSLAMLSPAPTAGR